VILLPAVNHNQDRENPIQCQERLGGLLRYYDRKAAA
jgi:hypothetical protein